MVISKINIPLIMLSVYDSNYLKIYSLSGRLLVSKTYGK